MCICHIITQDNTYGNCDYVHDDPKDIKNRPLSINVCCKNESLETKLDPWSIIFIYV